MKTSDKGLGLIKAFEQFRGKPYLPTVHDVWTIGWGTTVYPTGAHVSQQDPAINEETGTVYLRHDIQGCENDIAAHVKVPLTQNQFDALVSFIYNVGSTAFDNSTLLKLLNNGQYATAAEQFLRWNRQGGKVLRGLTRRRQAEHDLFLGL